MFVNNKICFFANSMVVILGSVIKQFIVKVIRAQKAEM